MRQTLFAHSRDNVHCHQHIQSVVNTSPDVLLVEVAVLVVGGRRLCATRQVQRAQAIRRTVGERPAATRASATSSFAISLYVEVIWLDRRSHTFKLKWRRPLGMLATLRFEPRFALLRSRNTREIAEQSVAETDEVGVLSSSCMASPSSSDSGSSSAGFLRFLDSAVATHRP